MTKAPVLFREPGLCAIRAVENDNSPDTDASQADRVSVKRITDGQVIAMSVSGLTRQGSGSLGVVGGFWYEGH